MYTRILASAPPLEEGTTVEQASFAAGHYRGRERGRARRTGLDRDKETEKKIEREREREKKKA